MTSTQNREQSDGHPRRKVTLKLEGAGKLRRSLTQAARNLRRVQTRISEQTRDLAKVATQTRRALRDHTSQVARLQREMRQATAPLRRVSGDLQRSLRHFRAAARDTERAWRAVGKNLVRPALRGMPQFSETLAASARDLSRAVAAVRPNLEPLLEATLAPRGLASSLDPPLDAARRVLDEAVTPPEGRDEPDGIAWITGKVGAAGEKENLSPGRIVTVVMLILAAAQTWISWQALQVARESAETGREERAEILRAVERRCGPAASGSQPSREMKSATAAGTAPIRSGPSAQSEVQGVLLPSDHVRVLDEDGRWRRVSVIEPTTFERKTGWLQAEFLGPERWH